MSDKFTDILKSDIQYEILLPEYYQRNVESNFIYPNGEKGMKIFTIYMIPDTDKWLYQRMNEIRIKMHEAGYKNIDFKMTTDYVKMTDDEVENYVKHGDFSLKFEDWWKENFTTKDIIESLSNMDISTLAAILFKK